MPDIILDTRDVQEHEERVRQKRIALEGHKRTPTELEAAVGMHEISREADEHGKHWKNRVQKIGAGRDGSRDVQELRRRADALAEEYKKLAEEARQAVEEHVQDNPEVSRETYANAARTYAGNREKNRHFSPVDTAYLGRILIFESVIGKAGPETAHMGRQVVNLALRAIHTPDPEKARDILSELASIPGFVEAENRIRTLGSSAK